MRVRAWILAGKGYGFGMTAFAGIVFLGLLLLAGGCNQGSKSNQNAGGNGAATPATTPGDYTAVLEKAHTMAIKTADLSSLNNAVGQFNVAEGRYPKDLDELISMKYFPRLPAPPAGMKYDYDPATGRVGLSPK